MLEEKQIRSIADKIVKEAKRTANYEQGTLQRSISYTYVRGVLVFRQMFYGVYNDNSQLEKLAKRYVPRGTMWRMELLDFGGSTKEVSRTKQGTAAQKSAKSLLGGGLSILSTVKNLRKAIARGKKKVNNGKT